MVGTLRFSHPTKLELNGRLGKGALRRAQQIDGT